RYANGLQGIPTFHMVHPHDRLRLFRCSKIYSEVRIDNANMVHVGFLSPCCTKGAPSTTNRFLQSWAWHHLFKADVFGSSPIRTVPTSWMISPGFLSP